MLITSSQSPILSPLFFAGAKTIPSQPNPQSSSPSESDVLASCIITRTRDNARSTYLFSAGTENSWLKVPQTISSSTVVENGPLSPPSSPKEFFVTNQQFSVVGANPSMAIPFIEEMGAALKNHEIDASAVISVRLPTTRNGGNPHFISWPAFVSNGTFFLKVPSAMASSSQSVGFKESIIAALELAETVLKCSSIVVCLERSTSVDLTPLLRSFLFVGFELVHPTIYNVNERFILVGQSLF